VSSAPAAGTYHALAGRFDSAPPATYPCLASPEHGVCAVDEPPGPAARTVLTSPLLCQVVVRPEFRPRQGFLHEVSPGTVGLALTDPLPAGTALTLQLAASRPGLSRVVGARVRRAVQLPGGPWLMACALMRPFTREEVRSLVEACRP
jgi:hypothetical protein